MVPLIGNATRTKSARDSEEGFWQKKNFQSSLAAPSPFSELQKAKFSRLAWKEIFNENPAIVV